ncbi:MAG: IS200/IS605 family transposase [bacterium]|nr:IS200/IS605 family transposase [bacterium]
MSHSYFSTYTHYVFSTKGRKAWITSALRERLFEYLGGIAKQHNIKSLRVGGTENHIHHLVSLPSTLSVAKAIQLLKGNSSKWIHDSFPAYRYFEWQEGYGAFSISISQVEKTIAYINNQQEHHRLKTFEEEFVQFLKKHQIEYDERYVWG